MKFEKVLILQGFEGILDRKMVIFDEVKSGEMAYLWDFIEVSLEVILSVLFENWIFEVDV